jgi:hypothetical protein
MSFSGAFFYKSGMFSMRLITYWHTSPSSDFNRRIVLIA